jgi:hypothetical protein
MMWSRQLSTVEMSSVVNYLMTKYQLTPRASGF